jgi:hypothetical protein
MIYWKEISTIYTKKEETWKRPDLITQRCGWENEQASSQR